MSTEFEKNSKTTTSVLIGQRTLPESHECLSVLTGQQTLPESHEWLSASFKLLWTEGSISGIYKSTFSLNMILLSQIQYITKQFNSNSI